MMNRVFTFILLFNLMVVTAQVRFGRVSVEELQQTQNEEYPEAPAEIISKVANYDVHFNRVSERFEVNKSVEVRIKIYDKDKTPNRYLNVAIPSYILGVGEKDRISGVRATTYNLENGKVQSTSVKRSDIFTEKINEYVEVQKLAFPNVSNGSIIEYKYNINTRRFFDLDTWYIQAEIPVKYNKFYVEYPEFFNYRKDTRGEFTQNIRSNHKNTNYRFRNMVDEVVYENVPPLLEEPFVQNTDNLRTSIRYELQEYNDPGYGYQNYSLTWTQIVKDLFDSSSYGGELKGNNFLDNDVSDFLNMEDNVSKIQNIFDFVQNNYTWNGRLGLYPENGTRKTYQEKSGNGTDLNFILISMLEKAGFNAYPIVLSTVENGMLNYFPSKQKLNHSISGVMLNNEFFIMDPTDKYSKVNLLPSRDLNFTGYMIMQGGSYKEIELVNRHPSEVKNILTYEIKDNLVDGTFVQTRTNYFAMNDLNLRSRNESNFEKIVLSRHDYDAKDFNFFENAKGDAIRYQIKFEDEKAIEEIGNKMFIKPLLFTATNSNAFKFKNEERRYPLEFGTPFTYATTAQFLIPEGYEIESLPNPQNHLLPQNVGGFNIQFNHEDDKIIVQSVVHIGYSLLPQNFYTDIKDMFEKIIESENQQIILQRK